MNWTKKDKNKLIKLYSNTSNYNICKILNRSVGSINQKRVQLKLKKSKEFISNSNKQKQVLYLKTHKHQRVGKKHSNKTIELFKKLHKGKVAWNKGMKKEELKKHYPKGWNTPIMKGKKNPKWKEKIDLICNWCDKKYKKNKSVSVYSKFCSKRCKLKYFSKAHSGKGNPNYKNGISLYRKNIKDFCEVCNKQYKHLVVHHKNKDRKNNKQSNLMTLCRSCHLKIHKKR